MLDGAVAARILRPLWRAALLALLVPLIMLLGASLVDAQSAPSISSSQASVQFPEGIRFNLEAQAPGEIERVQLRYTILPDGVPTNTVADCAPPSGATISCSVLVRGNDPPRIYIPPFTELRYSWEVVPTEGPTARSEEQSVVYTDTRFEWAQQSEANLTIYSYGNTDAAALLSAGRAALDRTSSLLATPVSFPVKVVAYASREDMAAALQNRSATFGELVVTLGVRVSSDTVIVLNDEGAVATLQHELAHVVTKQAGEGTLGGLPAWLDEGTAVYAQDNVDFGYLTAYENAVESDSLLSLRAMSSPTGNPENVNLFYGQSYAFVRYLVDTYGEERFAQLFATFKAGARVDEALQDVYGKDLLELENEWRAALGLPPRSVEEARAEAERTATFTPLGAGGIALPSTPDAADGEDDAGRPVESNDDDDDDGVDGATVAVIAVAAVAALGATAGGGVALYRYRRR
ncbi:MAG TPA: peptidase MA family metallohydrolase [Dehalococcoidia bacterium]|nr:peptidase MA family metallohydrolase [Dehalococcoidia bacterium]